MRAVFLAVSVALSATVAAQGNLLTQIPQCAQTCFGNQLGSCGPLDIACICGNKEVINGVSCCVFATCTQEEIQSTIKFATDLCKLQNVEVDTTPDCPANGTSSASSAAPSGTASLTQISGSASAAASAAASSAAASSAAAAASTAGAPLQTAGAGIVGAAVAGILALL